MKTWKRRWFILTDNCLYYFEYTTVSMGQAARLCAQGPYPRCAAGPGEAGRALFSCRTRSPGASSPWKTSASGRWRTRASR